MRLQLTVQRHGLPPVYVLWTVASIVRPPLLAAGNSITVSQFLEQVNEILPLESENWGLEDYSVEVRGFECLHFSELTQVLKEDDEVCIRPLQTQDLRFRKISGRHQIAADGKHLVDGVAFGRPFLRRADRPAIRIPPRKRRRITYDEEDEFDTEEPNTDRQVILRAGFNDADEATAGDKSDDEEDFDPDDDEVNDLSAELEYLQNDFDGGADADEGINQQGFQSQRTTRSRRSPKGLGLLQLLDDNGHEFAGQYDNPLLDLYAQDEAPSSQPEIRVRKSGTSHLIQNSPENIKSILRDSSASPQRVSRRDSTGSNRSVRFEIAEPATPATIRESEDAEDTDDGDFEAGETDESDKENSQPRDEETGSSDSFFKGSQSSSSASSDDQLSGDETSTSGSSSSASSSASEPEQQPIKDIINHSETSETSSSGSSSSGSSDFEPEPPKMSKKRKWAVHDVKSKTPADEAPPVVPTSALVTTPPGKGKNETRSRNKRRKESKRLAFMKRKGILPFSASKADLFKFEESVSQPEMEEILAVGGVRAAFEAKRRDLLASIAAGGVDASVDPSPQENDIGVIENLLPGNVPPLKVIATLDTIMTDQPASTEGLRKFGAENPSANGPNSTSNNTEVRASAAVSPAKAKDSPPTDSVSTTTTAIVPDSITTRPVEAKGTLMDGVGSTAPAAEVLSSTSTPAPDSQHRRSKLDMTGAKRMLFGSLGLRTPKTKEDEFKTREKLMKDVRPTKEPRVNEKESTVEDVAAAVGDESWKDRIDLRAVECCYEGIELSTPPFPFVQRWDPQQQRGYNVGNSKKRKGKKRKRNNSDYYGDNAVRPLDKAAGHKNLLNYEEQPSTRENEVAGLQDKSSSQEAEWESSAQKAHAVSKYQEHLHDENFEDSIKISEQLLHETEGASADTLAEMEETNGLTKDLPNLPEDLSALPSLNLHTTAKGNIVAFKQLEMSAQTNWQPKISGYRTAIVDAVLDDGTLSMTLAKRDQSFEDVQYDEQTGERLYSKFEMPGYDDGIRDDNIGKIEISFDELISPILVEAASENGNQDDPLQAQGHVVTQIDAEDKGSTVQPHNKGTCPQGIGLDGQNEIFSEEAAEPSEEARQEISELIRDAGWRSSIVNHELKDRQDDDPPGQKDVFDESAHVEPPSPTFDGFSSSPLTNGFQVASSPPAAAPHTKARVHASGLEIAESIPPQNSPARSIISSRRSAINYPDLPQTVDDSDVFQQEAQDRSGLLEADHQIASQDLTSPSIIHQSSSESIASPIPTSAEESSFQPVNMSDGAGSDESFPELFSQAFEKRLSQGRDVKPRLSDEDPISPPGPRRSNRNGGIEPSSRQSGRDWGFGNSEGEDDDDGASTPRPSQPDFSSQIVDLTISSDTVDPPDDSYKDDDSYHLPKGPGWVQKPRTSISRDGSMRESTSRRSTRSR